MIEHHITGIRRPASGTGTHNHHRARLEHRGDSVGYWRCSAGIAPTFACPDEPDPWVRLSEKAAARPQPRRVARLGGAFCPGGHLPGPRDAEGRCVECRREQMREAARKYRQRHRSA